MAALLNAEFDGKGQGAVIFAPGFSLLATG